MPDGSHVAPSHASTELLDVFLQEETKEPHHDGDEDEDEDEDVGGGKECCGSNLLVDCRSAVWEFYVLHKLAIMRVLLLVLVVLYFVYFGYAMTYEVVSPSNEGTFRLVWVTCLVGVILLLVWLYRLLRPQLQQLRSSNAVQFISRYYGHINWFVVLFLVAPLHSHAARRDLSSHVSVRP